MPSQTQTDITSVAIIGTGFSGLAAAIRLKEQGEHDFVVFEKAEEVGGTWRENDYPGAACDVPSHMYSFSFEPKHDWSRTFAPQPEILGYLRHCADKYGVREHVRFNSEITGIEYDDDTAVWTVNTADGQAFQARNVVLGIGPLHVPAIPEVPGIETFQGPAFHSARWDHDFDLTDKRVAVIGTGASAIQIVPAIQPVVGELHIVQRTPAWVMPKPERPGAERLRRVLDASPRLRRLQFDVLYAGAEVLASARRVRLLRAGLQRVGRRHLADQVPDPDLRARLTPDFEYLCKRPLISNSYLPAVGAANTTLHTGGLSEVRGATVVAGDGTEAEVDVIVLNTGFQIGVTSPIARLIRDADGLSLNDHWGDRPRAYLGMSYPGFPNFFLTQGPNATSGASSTLLFAEAQGRYIADAVVTMAREGIEVVDVRPEVERRWTRRIRRRSARTVYEQGGCASYYQSDDGINVVMWPANSAEYQLRTRRFRLAPFRTLRGPHGAGRPLTPDDPEPTVQPDELAAS